MQRGNGIVWFFFIANAQYVNDVGVYVRSHACAPFHGIPRPVNIDSWNAAAYGRMEKQETESGNGHGKRKRTWKMEKSCACSETARNNIIIISE